MTTQTIHLTARQRELFAFIAAEIGPPCPHCGRGNPAPTVREICKKFNIASPNGVECHLKALRSKGLIGINAKRARGISLTELGRKIAGTESTR